MNSADFKFNHMGISIESVGLILIKYPLLFLGNTYNLIDNRVFKKLKKQFQNW